jgi:hypothetical protein
MIHRPFLLAAAAHDSAGIFETNVQACLDAARQTIQLLHQTFIHRPFFRTWWYNTTYAFNAASVVLYVLVAGLHREGTSGLLLDIEKTLEIFRAMDTIKVARRCAMLTREFLECAKLACHVETGQAQFLGLSQNAAKVSTEQGTRSTLEPTLPQPNPSQTQTANSSIPNLHIGGSMLWDPNIDLAYNSNVGSHDYFANLTDTNILNGFGANFLGFEGDLDVNLDGGAGDMGWDMVEMNSYGNMWGF